MEWSDVLSDPCLQDLPYKIELNEYGKIVMSPASNRHGRQQAEIIGRLIAHMQNGQVVSECSVHTTEGVKVADVAWQSEEFKARHGEVTPLPAAPEICVEILSPSNSTVEMDEKKRLYFEAGAHEVWLCDIDGTVTFHSIHGQLERSQIAPEFPTQI